MPRYKEMITDQGLLIPVTLAHQLSPGTFEHALNYIVDHKLDLSVFDRRYKNEDGGASAYNPRPMFRDVLLYCDELELMGKEMFAIDGCKISSNASKARTSCGS